MKNLINNEIKAIVIRHVIYSMFTYIYKTLGFK